MSYKKQATPKNKPSQKQEVVQKPISEKLEVSTPMLIGLSILLAFSYFLYSFQSTGFYQQDEAAHFISMREFWYAPNSVLSNWAKAGYKLIYAVPSLLGSNAVTFLNCIFSAASAFLAYKIAQKAGSKVPLLAFLALASQPLWFNLAFRNYSEIPTAFLLALAVFGQQRQKFWLSALALSYVSFIRQEFLPLLGLYFLWLAYQKQFLALVLTTIFPLIQNIWGGIVKNDPLYLLNQILKSGSEIAAAYPRQGFEHYFLMSVTIFGSVVVALFLVYGVHKILQKNSSSWEIWFPILYYIFLQAVFNIQSIPIGPAGGGNLRYLLLVSPLLAVTAALAADQLSASLFRKKVLAVLGIFAFIVAIFMTYENNYIFLTEERDWKPLFGVLMVLFLAIFKLNPRQYAFGFGFALFFTALIIIRPIARSEEDKTCEKLAKWYLDYESKNGKKALLLHHAMFYYFLERTSYDFEPKATIINEKTLESLPKGGLIIWDSHYSYRPELRKDALPHTYFLERSDQYRVVHAVDATTPDGQYTVFAAIVFEKL